MGNSPMCAQPLGRMLIPLFGAPCGLWGYKNRPAPFPGQMS